MRYFVLFLVGAIIGGVATFYFFVGPPHIKALHTGAAVAAPEATGDPPGTAILTLDEKFFDAVLDTLFRDLNAPSFRLSATRPDLSDTRTGAQFVTTQAGQGGCTNQVTVARDANGVRTGVQLQNGQINAPIVFSGSYNAFGNCMNFNGTAQAHVELNFKAEDQTLSGQISVVGVNIENLPPMIKPFAEPVIAAFVQNAINERGNPVTILRGQQLTLNLPVQTAAGTLRAQAKDIRAEVKDGALRLHITYAFTGTRGATTQPAPQS
ncbi:MAG TPA: hypothetical protein VE821_08605 [Pyrinomonadaceae bacterium]|nr:hypothetical protein [Pyrinomonadaceae bacterium]